MKKSLGLILFTICISISVVQVKAEDVETRQEDYTVTIPADVKIPEDTRSTEIPIKAKLESNTNLVINVDSQNNFNLVNPNNQNNNKNIGYSISDKKPLVFSNQDNSSDEGETYKLKVTLNRGTYLYSGEYTDVLTFYMSSERITDTQNYCLKFDVNVENEDDVTITTRKKVLKDGEAYGTLPTPRRTGYDFEGWYTSKEDQDEQHLVTEETIMGSDNVTLYAKWKVHTFKNTMTFWAWGLKKAEGNNGPGTAIRLADNASAENITEYGCEYKFTKAMAKAAIPNGYEMKQFGSATVETAEYKWRRYDFNSNGIFSGIQPDWVVNAEYEYDPIDYKITYNLGADNAVNDDENPKTYTVLYGVKFKEPTRKGYKFEGWYTKDGTKVTGINENCDNSSFANKEKTDYTGATTAFYAALKDRTTGDIILTAHWVKEDNDSSNTETIQAVNSEVQKETAVEDVDSSTEQEKEEQRNILENSIEEQKRTLDSKEDDSLE